MGALVQVPAVPLPTKFLADVPEKAEKYGQGPRVLYPPGRSRGRLVLAAGFGPYGCLESEPANEKIYVSSHSISPPFSLYICLSN